MSLRGFFDWGVARVEAFFAEPEPNAAGRMGWFRIVFALLYLWHLSLFDASLLAGIPAEGREEMLVLAPFPDAWSVEAFRWLERAMVAALVLLLVGWRARWMCGVLLVLGILREAWPSSVAIENSNVFITLHIPFFMMVAGRWDDTHSLTAWLRRRRGEPTVSPTEDAWPWFLGARVLLVVLAALFTSSPIFKGFLDGTWLERPDLLANLMLIRNVKAATLGLPVNPFAPWIASHPWFYQPMQIGVLLFEGLFFVALFGRTWRNAFLATALVFHSFNALFLVVSFTPVLAVYAAFVDWEALWRRVRPAGGVPIPDLPPTVAIGLAWAAALALALTWHAGVGAVFSLGGWIDWHRPFYALLPLAAVVAAVQTVRLARGARSWIA